MYTKKKVIKKTLKHRGPVVGQAINITSPENLDIKAVARELGWHIEQQFRPQPTPFEKLFQYLTTLIFKVKGKL